MCSSDLQTVIGLEALEQFEQAEEYPDVAIGCAGGGSNFAGFALPFVRNNLVDGKTTRIVAVEPSACPTLTKGKYLYDFGDAVATTPLLMMYTLGHSFVPAPVHAGGLRYHGVAPIVSALHDRGLIEAVAVPQNPVFEAAVQFARAEAIIPAPESAHAIKVAIDEALRAKEEGVSRVIAFNLSGHGHFDMGAYDEYVAGNLPDYELDSSEVDKALAGVPS